MGKASRIMRKSVFTFLQNFQFFTSAPSLLSVPFAVSALLSQPLVSSSSLFPLVHGRLRSVFLAAGFPPSSELFVILNLKLSQTVLSFLVVLPFTLSFLLLAKASVIRALEHQKTPQRHAFFSWIMIFNPLFITNFATHCLSSHGPLLLLSATGAIIYSIILANAYIICNLALLVSGIERQGGFNSILKACVLIRGRTATALSLAVPINMALAAVEALFQYRVVRAYRQATTPDSSMVLEAMLIAYLYAILLVLDTILGFAFLKSCKPDYQIDHIEIQERNDKSLRKIKGLELLL
ncbi:UNVERIFIED_CONTAM: hypothetical protein Sangu_3184200 [Sesamum angustifolium]|uniref:Transmembrane protein n=1 Tax=Sesamum angustifolium TaxID=2727405 RepID=A0AAW2JP66_9LAMI